MHMTVDVPLQPKQASDRCNGEILQWSLSPASLHEDAHFISQKLHQSEAKQKDYMTVLHGLNVSGSLESDWNCDHLLWNKPTPSPMSKFQWDSSRSILHARIHAEMCAGDISLAQLTAFTRRAESNHVPIALPPCAETVSWIWGCWFCLDRNFFTGWGAGAPCPWSPLLSCWSCFLALKVAGVPLGCSALSLPLSTQNTRMTLSEVLGAT